MNVSDAMQKLMDHFGSREGVLADLLINLSMTGQPCDITFHKRPPAIDVVVDQQIHTALMYGAGAKKLGELLRNIRLNGSHGQSCRLDEIWTILPMPKGGISQSELEAVDMSRAEEQAGPNGETLRKMIRDTYRCKDREEEDSFIRRYLAS